MKSFISLFALSLLSSALGTTTQPNPDNCQPVYGGCADPNLAASFLRAFNPSSKHHFFTTNTTEMAIFCQQRGYGFEGSAASVFTSQQPDTVPLYRLFYPPKTDYFYTASVASRDAAIGANGYVSEGIAAYVYNSSTCGSIPLYMIFNPTTIDHHYTASVTERDNALANPAGGYVDEGIVAYVLPNRN